MVDHGPTHRRGRQAAVQLQDRRSIDCWCWHRACLRARARMIPISLSDLDRATACLYGRETRIVGWGTGSVFDYFHTHYPIRLDYIVDNDESRLGRRIAGINVVAPSRLAEENPGKTLVVIYSSAWPEIQHQIAALGPFAAVPASAAFADASV